MGVHGSSVGLIYDLGLWAFPVLPWGTLKAPKCLDTKRGYPLLISGWVGLARNIHYTADFVMALIWALACGCSADLLPFLYPVFYLVMIRQGGH
jgi:delta24(24(1))-sterol reductase